MDSTGWSGTGGSTGAAVNYEAGSDTAILAVHGGPESHVSNGWVTSYSNPGQLAAARVCGLLSQLSRQYRARRRVLDVGPGRCGRQRVR